MIRRTFAIWTIAFAVAFAAAPVPLPAQGGGTAAAVRTQELAKARFAELTERMAALMTVLQKDEPEESKLIAAGLRFAKERKLESRLDEASRLLQSERWGDALVVMGDLKQDLERLLELLQNRNADLRELLDEIAKLEAFRSRVEQLAAEQFEHKEASARTEQLQQHLAELERQKQRTEQLLAQQRAVRDETNRLPLDGGSPDVALLAQREKELQERTEQLAKDLEKVERNAAELAKSKPSAGQPKEGQSKDGQSKDGKPNEGAPSQPGGGSCSGQAQKAAQAMGRAEQQLGARRPEPALKDQDQALAELQRTIEELERLSDEARRELQQLPFDEQAQRQQATEHATDTLAKDMEQAEQGEQGEAKQPTPGKKRVQQAVPKQRAAAGQLKEYVPAKQKQQDAKDDLDAAKQELDEALAQLRQQLQDEVLRSLEERFTAMLARQRQLSAETRTLDATRGRLPTRTGELPAALVAKITELADGEGALEVEAGDALKLLEEDGTTALFPTLVEELRDELRALAQRLRERSTDAGVQAAQREVEDMLELLINALRRTIEQREGGQGSGKCNGEPPLVPMSAELKMLRFLQERVNVATKQIHAAPPAAAAGTTAHEALAQKQARVRDLTRLLAVKLGKENDVQEGR